MVQDTTRSERIVFRLRPAVAAQVKARAAALGLTVSEFVRISVLCSCGMTMPSTQQELKETAFDQDDEKECS